MKNIWTIILKKEQKEKEELDNISNIDLVKEYISQGIDKKEAIKKVAKLKGINKNEVYKDCIDI